LNQGIQVDKDKKLRARDNVVIGTWNTRTLRPDGKLEELVHEMDRYHWNIIGLCETRLKNMGEIAIDEGHKLYYSGREDKHLEGVGFLVHRDILDTVMECRPISSRLMTIRIRAAPFNITVVQVYAPTTDHDDNVIEDFYSHLQETIDKTAKKDVIIIQGDWNAKLGQDAQVSWKGTCGQSCNLTTNERGLRLLEFASTNRMVVANTLGAHKYSRRTTWQSPKGHKNQIDYILVPKRFRSGINVERTRSFPGADIGSDHDLVMMTFRMRLTRVRKQKFTRLRFDLDKLKDPAIKEQFQAKIGGRFAPLTVLDGN